MIWIQRREFIGLAKRRSRVAARGAGAAARQDLSDWSLHCGGTHQIEDLVDFD